MRALLASWSRGGWIALPLVGWVLSIPSAGAVGGFDANRYLAPPLAVDGLTLARPTTLAAGTWGLGLAISHADDALEGRLDGGGTSHIVEEQLWVYGFLAYGLFERLTLHATLPAPIRQVGEAREAADVTARLHAFAAGDLRLGGRLALTSPPRPARPFAMAVDAALLIPTGSREAFASDGKVRVQLTAIGEVLTSDLVFVGGTVGVLTRPELELAGTTTGTLLQLGASAGLRGGADALRLGLEGNAQIPLGHAGASYEVLGVARLSLFRRLHASVGAGPGIGAGWQTPDFRAVARLGWAAEAPR